MKVDNFFEKYLNLCSKYKDEIEEFYKNNVNEISEFQNKVISNYTIKPTSEVINSLPIIKITLDKDNQSVVASELVNSNENIYRLFNYIVTKNEINLSDLIKNGKKIIPDEIFLNISSTDGNNNNISDILFSPNVNLKQEIIKEIIDVIPPFNGIINDEYLEIIVNHSSNSDVVKSNLKNFLSPLNISYYFDESISGGVSNDLNIVAFNRPSQGLKTIFSLNINESFYDISKRYFEHNENKFKVIIDKIYDNVIDYNAGILPDKYFSVDLPEKSFQYIFRGFDGKFEDDFNNIKLEFSNKFRDYNFDLIKNKIAIIINNKYPNDLNS